MQHKFRRETVESSLCSQQLDQGPTQENDGKIPRSFECYLMIHAALVPRDFTNSHKKFKFAIF